MEDSKRLKPYSLPDLDLPAMHSKRHLVIDHRGGTIQTARQQTARQVIKKYLEGWVGQVTDTTWTNC
uniref:Uncharacterized protein n=1 Tax=Timema cristinae TaxID=61476 RepID=A0A7R9DJF6_TIMCR|nr:unnamed protein product [Timema cristinae]